jgi:hypothetical protein
MQNGTRAKLSLASLVLWAFAPTSASAQAQRLDAQVTFAHPGCNASCIAATALNGGAGPISASNTATLVTSGVGGTLTTTETGASQASFGELRVSTTHTSVSTASSYPSPFFDSAGASASFDDGWATFNRGGQPGTATFTLIVDGSTAASGLGTFDASARITVNVYGTGVNLPGSIYTLNLFRNRSSNPANPNMNTQTLNGVQTNIPSIFGVYQLVIPYRATGTVGLQISIRCDSSTRISGGSGTYSQSCDMANTVRWGGLVSAVDSAGVPVTLSIRGSSGTDYVQEIGAVDRPPTASAGSDFSVNEGQAGITLNGSGSADPDEDSLTYAWEQVDDGTPLVTLAGATTAQPTFTAPVVAFGGEVLTFRLTVTANGVSAADTVSVSVVNRNHTPVADAGDDQSVAEGTTGVTLHGENSFDSDNDPFTRTWTQVSGPEVTLTGANSANPTFTAPIVDSGGAAGVVATLVFELRVGDGFPADLPADGYAFDADVDTVTVNVTNVNNAPAAAAGEDQTVNEQATVALNAGGSGDPDNDPLSFSWRQVGGPTVTLSGAGSSEPGFTAPFVSAGGADLLFEVTVNDGYGGTSTDLVVIHVQNLNDPPLASAARPTVASIWPPNHGMVSVGITGVTDVGNNATITISGVTQDEPTNGLGDGDTAIDAVINADGTVLLRAERAGNGDGRVYRISFIASDLEGSSSGVVVVTVPHSAKKPAIDSGLVVVSTEP